MSALARPGPAAAALVDAFARYRECFDAITRRAAERFAAREWRAAQRDAVERLTLYAREVDAAVARTRGCLGAGATDRSLWSVVRADYARRVAELPDAEIAGTFFNSVVRRMFGTVGVDTGVEFTGRDADGALEAPHATGEPFHTYALGDGTEQTVRGVLRALPLRTPLADAAGDATRIAGAIDAGARDATPGVRPDRLEVLAPVFYRNKGAYVVGRLRAGATLLPLVIALVHDRAGVRADAVLTTTDEASVVFGFSWSYFHVEVRDPRAVVEFLRSIMPLKRVDELYTAIGFNRHGKTELYRALLAHLAQPGARFERAEGERGLVMTVFTLPSFNVVFKVIRDTFGPPKEVTRRQVMEQYRFVFMHDRVGRLADAQEFEQLELPRHCFPDELLAELLAAAPSAVRASDERVVVAHCYTQRRLVPLDRFIRVVDAEAARAAVVDYGQAIKDLAYAGIFAGDLLVKNFGVSRHARVIFYDYDELTDLDRCRFRELPESDNPDDEMSAEPWFSVGPNDVFPEEFLPFLLPVGPLRDAFVEAHADLLRASWWREVQARVRAGELFDVFPYAARRRLATDQYR